MTLSELKEHIESFDKGHKFDFGLSEPFSWRGIYAEVAFDIIEETMSRDDILDRIDMAYKESFGGYKGGTYAYDDHTPVHFERDYGSWTDGQYVRDWIEKVTEDQQYEDDETKLTKLIFTDD